MALFEELVDDLESFMYSMGTTRDKVTSLNADAGIGDSQIAVSDGAVVDRGIVQIDDELLAVSSVSRDADPTTGQFYVALQPWGRGVSSTTPAPHSAGTKVTVNPRWPRVRLTQEVNSAILALYPTLYAVKAITLTANSLKLSYSLPADAESIISVKCQTLGGTGFWQPVHRFSIDRVADTDAFPTGKALNLFSPTVAGRKIRVTYRAAPTKGATGVTLAALGVDERWRDLIRMAAAAKLLLAVEPGRLQVDSVETGQRAATVQPSSAAAVSRALMQQYTARLADEAKRLQKDFPISQTIQG